MSTTEDRIESLENQVCRQRRWNIALGAVVVVGGLMAATGVRSVPDVIQAKKFEVVNDEGKVIASLSANMGGGMLSVSNKDGEVVVGLGSDEVNGGGVLGINNKEGKRVAGIHADKNGGVSRVFNNNFTEVAGIRANADGDGLMMTSGSKGKVTSRTP